MRVSHKLLKTRRMADHTDMFARGAIQITAELRSEV